MILITSLLAAVCLYYYFLNSSTSSEVVNKEEEEVFLSIDNTTSEGEGDHLESEPSTIVVDVKGAIQTPGVYSIHADARVHEIIERAGGLSDKADEQAINLASRLEDGMVVYIPFIGENKHIFSANLKEEEQDEKVNINVATSEELQALPGIGPSKAVAIISFREENGHFKSTEALLEVTGIGEKSLDKLKEKITVK